MKNKRRLDFLISKNYKNIFAFRQKDEAKRLLDSLRAEPSIYKMMKPWIENLVEIHEIFDVAKLSRKDRLLYWTEVIKKRQEQKEPYKRGNIKPERKDNKTRKNVGKDNNSSSQSSNHRIRFPRKARKTAWRRFYKLFPEQKPKKNEESE